jgi:hypothetical protein
MHGHMNIKYVKESINYNHWMYSGPGSLVGIATGYELDGLGIELQ